MGCKICAFFTHKIYFRKSLPKSKYCKFLQKMKKCKKKTGNNDLCKTFEIVGFSLTDDMYSNLDVFVFLVDKVAVVFCF